jgi:hypothetical protein
MWLQVLMERERLLEVKCDAIYEGQQYRTTGCVIKYMVIMAFTWENYAAGIIERSLLWK